MSRPEMPIDWKKVDDLMIAGCLGTQIAAYFCIHPNTFYRRVEEKYQISFSEYLSEKKSKGESILKAHQYAKALGLTDKGDNTLLIWLGKNRLKQKDHPDDNFLPPLDSTVDQENQLMLLRSQLTKAMKKIEELEQKHVCNES